MMLVWIIVVALVAIVTVVLLKRGGSRPEPVARTAVRPAPTTTTTSAPTPALRAAPGTAAPEVVVPEAPMPAALVGVRIVQAEELPQERREHIVATFKNVPRPPKLLQHLLSPGFVNAADSTQLVDMITGEPLIAAKVLAAVNSPAYGLKAPVSSIGQAVTYLGLNTVRTLCLQYILIASFKADSPERKETLDGIWTASALASELTQRLAQRLDFADRGSLVSSVVLSFLGRLATTATVAKESLPALVAPGLLARTLAEQHALGLSATQIGRLLMNDWGLPAQLVDDAAGIDSVLVTPASAFDADRGSRLALCYACARLGERLADGELKDLLAFDAHTDASPEMHPTCAAISRCRRWRSSHASCSRPRSATACSRCSPPPTADAPQLVAPAHRTSPRLPFALAYRACVTPPSTVPAGGQVGGELGVVKGHGFVSSAGTPRPKTSRRRNPRSPSTRPTRRP